MPTKLHFISGITALPSLNLRRCSVPVRLKVMAQKHAIQWHTQIQPIIRNEANRAPRADSNWNWPAHFHLSHAVAKVFRRHVVNYVVEAQDFHLKWHLISMISTVSPVPAFDDHLSSSVYIWLLSTAPKSALKVLFNGNEPKTVGTTSLLYCILLSLQRKYKGRISLHAAPIGANELMSFYKHSLSLAQLPEGKAVPRAFYMPRKNDGRYFYSTAHVAHALLSRFNGYLRIRSISLH